MLDLKSLSSNLRSSNPHVTTQVVTAMAVRNYKVEGEIIKDIHAMSRCIKLAFKDAPRYMDLHASFDPRLPKYQQTFEYLARTFGGKDADALATKYGEIIVELVPGNAKSFGIAYFRYPNILELSYAASMLGAQSRQVKDFIPYLRGFDIAVEHELRHLIDSVRKTYGQSKLPSDHKTGSISEYMNFEHELDARITSLFVKLDQQFRGSALLALQGKVDAASKEHHRLLKATPDSFYLFCRSADDKYETQVFAYLNQKNKQEAMEKCFEFQKFLIEEYGMALRATKAEDITAAQKKAWKSLLESTKDIEQHKATITKIASR